MVKSPKQKCVYQYLIFLFQAYPEYLITYQIMRPEGMVDG